MQKPTTIALVTCEKRRKRETKRWNIKNSADLRDFEEEIGNLSKIIFNNVNINWTQMQISIKDHSLSYFFLDLLIFVPPKLFREVSRKIPGNTSFWGKVEKLQIKKKSRPWDVFVIYWFGYCYLNMHWKAVWRSKQRGKKVNILNDSLNNKCIKDFWKGFGLLSQSLLLMNKRRIQLFINKI